MVEVTYKYRHAIVRLIQGQNTLGLKERTSEIFMEILSIKKISELEIFRNKDVPEIDLMIGGPSCQGFSLQEGVIKEDPRNLLFGEYVRVIA